MKLVPDSEFQRLNNELRRKVKLEVDHLGGGNEGVSAFSHLLWALVQKRNIPAGTFYTHEKYMRKAIREWLRGDQTIYRYRLDVLRSVTAEIRNIRLEKNATAKTAAARVPTHTSEPVETADNNSVIDTDPPLASGPDTEINAIASVMDALGKVEGIAAKSRVLNYVADRYGITGVE